MQSVCSLNSEPIWLLLESTPFKLKQDQRLADKTTWQCLSARLGSHSLRLRLLQFYWPCDCSLSRRAIL